MTGDAELLLDTGALVALLHSRDRDHARCAQVLEGFRGTLLTTEPVLSEAMYLLGRARGGRAACLEFFARGGATLIPQSRGSLLRCQALMTRYENVPMDFADATLVYLARRESLSTVFTVDHSDFNTYRIEGRKRFRVIPSIG